MCNFAEEMERRTAEVFQANPVLDDHRAVQAWLTGWLGDPTQPVWLVAENPSATQVDRIHSSSATPDSQWAGSRGDRLLREALLEHGLKTGGLFEPGGWNCYLTDVMKSKVFVKDWNGSSTEQQRRVAEMWAPVLRFELEVGCPKRLIILGGNAEKALRHSSSPASSPSCHRLRGSIDHYSYVMQRPDKLRRPPSDPARQVEWKAALGAAAALVER